MITKLTIIYKNFYYFQTELRYAWGSQALTPVDKRVLCPPLEPGQAGKVAVLLQVPSMYTNAFTSLLKSVQTVEYCLFF